MGIASRVRIPSLHGPVDFSKIPPDGEPVDLLRLVIKKRAAKMYAPAFEILNVNGAVRHIDLMPTEQPLVVEALKLNV